MSSKHKRIDLNREENKPMLDTINRYRDCLENMCRHNSSPDLKMALREELAWLHDQQDNNYPYFTQTLNFYRITVNILQDIIYTFRRVKEPSILISKIVKNPYNFIDTDYVIISYEKCEEIRKTLQLNIGIERILKSWIINYIINIRNSFYIPKHIFEQDFQAEQKRLDQEIGGDCVYDSLYIQKIIEGNPYYTTTYFNKVENDITDFFIEEFLEDEQDIYRDLTSLINEYETLNSITFTAQQRDCIDRCVKNRFNLICGYPGTGKTTIVGCVIWILTVLNGEEYKKMISLVAPTGLAVLNLKRSCGEGLSEELIGTIHKMMNREKTREELGGEDGIREKIQRVRLEAESSDNQTGISAKLKTLQNYLAEPQLVIVDEISMVHLLMIYHLRNYLRGRKVIFLGDQNQLPPIGPGSILESIINSGIFTDKIQYLTEIKRQTGTLKDTVIRLNTTGIDLSQFSTDDTSFNFVNNNSVLKNTVPVRDIHKLSGVELETHSEAMRQNAALIKEFITSNNLSCDTTQFISPQKSYQAGYVYMNLILRDIYNPGTKDKEIPRNTYYDNFLFRIGDRVYRTVNKYVEDVLHANGEVGVIKQLLVKREFNKQKKEFEDKPYGVMISHTLEGLVDEQVTIQELYQDFSLDYCKTIHKCQGSQYDNIVLFMSNQHNYMWSNEESRNLLYTAISRAKQKCYIIGSSDGKLLRAAQFNHNGALKRLKPRVTLVFKESDNYSIE